MLEEELICDRCNGIGSILDDTGREDVCDKCFGLGYVKEVYTPPPLSESKLKLKRAIIYTFLALTVYYAAFSYSFIEFALTPVETLIILLAGHFAAVSFLVFYILIVAVRESS